MGKFDVGSLEDLEYDFTKFNGRAGVIDEPSTQRVNHFFTSIKDMMKEVKGITSTMEGIDLEDESKLTEALKSVDESAGSVSQFQATMMESIAELCGARRYGPDHEDEAKRGKIIPDSGAPSLNDLNTLPYRHLLAFNEWLMGQIRPKKTTPAGPR